MEARNHENNTTLLLAAQYGHVEFVKLLLEKGAAMEARNNEKNTPMLLAAKNGHVEVVKLLLENGV